MPDDGGGYSRILGFMTMTRTISCCVIFISFFYGVSRAGEIAFPFAGEAVMDDVNLRSGPGLNFEVVGKLGRGEKVTVCGGRGGWYKMVPPAGLPLWVSGTCISDGRVTCGMLNVRAGPTTASAVVCQLMRGEEIEEIEEEGDWIAIRAPGKAFLWVSRELITPLPGEGGKEMPGAGKQPAPVGSPSVPRIFHGRIERSEEWRGGHILVGGFMGGKRICRVVSETVNLSFYVGDSVSIWGYEKGLDPEGIPVIDVRRLEIR